MSRQNAGPSIALLGLVGLFTTACYDGSDGDTGLVSGGSLPTLTGLTSSTDPTSSSGATEPAVTSTSGATGSADATTADVPDDLSSGTGSSSSGAPTGGVDGETTTTTTTGVPDMTTGGDPPPPPSCAEVAGSQGWQMGLCENNGDGACDGAGQATIDCEHCCAAPSCGQLAGKLGWGDDALCEQNGDGICKGTGQPTWDCQLCCDASGLPGGGFGYPVGDGTTYPAGGWTILQVMAHYWNTQGGRHLAHDVRAPGGGAATVNAPVYAVADGIVRYAGPNNSTYKHMVLIEHQVPNQPSVCSFYGHINAPSVATGAMVKRGQQITTVIDWAAAEMGGSTGNTHLHYGIIRKALCDASAAAKGGLICGYDKAGPNGVVDLATEPYSYQPVGDLCNIGKYGDSFISPTKFIEDNHF